MGTTIRFTLSADTTVTAEFSQPVAGRRVGRACRPVTRANRRGSRCTIANVRGALTVKAHRGANRIRFQGRLPRGRTLKPGRYLLTLRPAGSASVPRSARFTIVR